MPYPFFYIRSQAGFWSTQVLPQADNLFYFIYENVVVEFVIEGEEVVKHIYYADGELQEEVPKIKDD